MVAQGLFEPRIFSDSLIETSWAQRSHRNWSTLTSFGVQAAIISLLLLLPLFRTVLLPAARTVSTPISLGRLRNDPAPLRQNINATVAATNAANPRIVAPGRVPTTVSMEADNSSIQPPSGIGCGDRCDLAVGAPEGLPLAITGTRPAPLPTPAPAPRARALVTSNMMEGSLIRRVLPAYPPLARAARVEGQVLLAATISKAGTIEDLKVLRGHPMLVKAALDAVSQWRYRPYVLNNEPVEVETQIMVVFTLSGN